MSSVYSNYIKRMRMCANGNCKGCTYAYEGLTNTEECKEDLLHDAAEQLEDADKCNARLVKKCKEMEKRIAELMPKEGEWIIDGMNEYELSYGCIGYEPRYRCSKCGITTESYLRTERPIMPEDADFPNYCPNCGAKMDGADGERRSDGRV